MLMKTKQEAPYPYVGKLLADLTHQLQIAKEENKKLKKENDKLSEKLHNQNMELKDVKKDRDNKHERFMSVGDDFVKRGFELNNLFDENKKLREAIEDAKNAVFIERDMLKTYEILTQAQGKKE
jgi:chromosome segregation ATPase